MITNGAKSLLSRSKQTSDYQRSKVFTGGAKKLLPTGQKLYWRSREVIVNRAKPLLAELTCDNQHSKTFNGGADNSSSTEQSLYWRSIQVIFNGAKPLLVEQTSDLQRSKVFTGGTDSDNQRRKSLTGGTDKLSSTEQSLYWRSRQVILNGAKPLLAEHTKDLQRSNTFTGGAQK